MTTLESLRNWGGPDDAFEVIRAQGQSADSWTAELRASVRPAFNLTVRKSTNAARISVVNLLEIPADALRAAANGQRSGESLQRLVAGVADMRAATLTCALSGDGSRRAVEIEVVIYEDGFSRHTLNAAVLESVKTRRLLEASFETMVESARLVSETDRLMEEEARRLRERLPHDPSEAPPLPASCPHCGASVRTGQRVCTSCGHDLTGRGAPRTPDTAEQHCPNPQCGRPIAAGRKFCTGCGTRVA
jgi:hypothetical protein